MSENLSLIENSEDNKKPKWLTTMFIGGVLLPIITLGVEFTTHICAENFFDPIPTLWHVLLIAFVPLSNSYFFYAVLKQRTERATLLGWSSALTVGITIFYSIFFLPLLPISLIAVFVAIGFLSLSPFLALIGTLLLRKNFLKIAPKAKIFPFSWKGLIAGMLIIFAVVLLAEVPFAVTRYGMEMANSENVEKQESGIEFLRKYGNENYLLRQTYWRKGITISDFLTNIYFGFGQRPDTEESRKIFYRLKGKTYNEVPRPLYVSGIDLGEDTVSGRESQRDRAIRENITLESSVIDGSIDSEAMLGYVEWTLVFKNSANWQEEAFAQIQLPKGGVVSRLTLWIENEEREAAFAGRRKVKEAYENIVRQRRDPVLVTTSGKDRVNMRCFPIQPDGGEMKLRIGITFPLQIENQTNGIVALPYFQERNFVIGEKKQHQVWYESKNPLVSSLQKYLLEKENDHYAIRGNLTNSELHKTDSLIKTSRSENVEIVWARDNKEDTEKVIKQQIIEVEPAKPSSYVFVVDTSLGLKDKRSEIVSAIKRLPSEIEIKLILTNGNALNQENSFPKVHVGKPSEIAKTIENTDFGGGTDNLPALSKAWNLAAENGKGVVFWLHAPQKLIFDTPTSVISQKFKRRPDQVEIYNFQLSEGLDKIESDLYKGENFQTVQRFGDLKSDLYKIISKLNNTEKSFDFKREVLEDKEILESKQAKETSDHLVRLWAFDEIKQLIKDGERNPENEGKAIELAMKYQLVTPVSGAVVLETKQQYDEAGLKPVDGQTVPTIPEPETYLLIAVLGLFLLYILFGRKVKFIALRT